VSGHQWNIGDAEAKDAVTKAEETQQEDDE